MLINLNDSLITDLVRIQPDFRDIVPVSGITAVPTLRMGSLCCLIYFVALLEDLFAPAGVALCRGEKLYPAVMVIVTIPFYEQLAPCTSLLDRLKALAFPKPAMPPKNATKTS